MAFKVFAGVLCVLGVGWAFGWVLPEDTGKAVGMVAAALLCLILSTVPVGPVP